MRLKALQLKTQDPEKAVDFYLNILGMQLVQTYQSDKTLINVLQFSKSTTTQLELHFDKQQQHFKSKYQQESHDVYWKYSLFVDNIQQVYSTLNGQIKEINEPFQFGNIGYLMHTKDIENYQIEFIQKTFKQSTSLPIKANKTFPLYELPVMGLITLRTKDPVKSIHFYETFFGMKLLVRMYVDRNNGFTLYFLGDNGLIAPNPDIDAIENREWMYQQNSAFIELQYYWNSEHQEEFELQTKEEEPIGFKGVKFETKDLEKVKSDLLEKNISFRSNVNVIQSRNEIQIMSPDKYPIIIQENESENN